MSSQIRTYSQFPQQIHHKPPPQTRNVISQRPRLLFVRIQQLVAVATLGLLLGLWFGGLRHPVPQPTYPYYDTEKPVPPWSEPGPLEDNYNTKGEYK